MPRKSLRATAIELMQAKVDQLRLMFDMREIMDEEDDIADDEFMEESDKLDSMKSNRYLFRSTYYRKDRNTIFDLDDAISHESKNINDEEFLSLFRITRDSFQLFLEEMKDKKAFVTKNNSCHQRPIAFQLLVYLYRIGKEGSGGGCGEVGIFFGISKGSVKNYVRRCVSALLFFLVKSPTKRGVFCPDPR